MEDKKSRIAKEQAAIAGTSRSVLEEGGFKSDGNGGMYASASHIEPMAVQPGMRVDGAFGRGTLSPDGNVLSLDFPQSQPSNLQPGNAPKVTPADIEAEIASEHYFTAADGVLGAQADHELLNAPLPLSLLTFCVLVLRNGFTVTGESACASPANFDAEVGRKVARQAAISKCWPLLGFRLRDRLASAEPTVDADKLATHVYSSDGGFTAHHPRDTSYLKAPAGMEIVSAEVIENPNDFGYLLRVTASVRGEIKTEARGFRTGHTPSATEKNKKAAHAQCIALLELAFGIKR